MAGRKRGPKDETPFGHAAARLEAASAEMVELQVELTKRNAVGPANGGPGELEKADFLEAWMRERGFPEIRRMTSDDNGVPRPNLAVILPGHDRSRRLWFMSHMDVVPPGDLSLWKSDPFAVRIEGDKLVGRGVEDNQQGLVSTLFAAKAILDEGIKPVCDIGLLLVSDEETSSRHGIHFLLDRYPDLFGPDDSFVVPDAGNEDGTMVEVAEKSILWLKLRTVGKQVHASTPNLGINAFTAGSHLVVKLRELYDRFDLRDPLFDTPMSTFEATKKEPNVGNINTIPGEDIFYLDCRILPQTSVEEVFRAVREMGNEVARQHRVVISAEVIVREEAAKATPADAPIVGTLIDSIRKVYKVEAKPSGIGGGTVAVHLRKKGLPVVVWSRMDDTAHQPNEYIWIPNMVGDAKVFADLMIGPQVPPAG
jgi:succinyl-diaminopimelate desuccinylase